MIRSSAIARGPAGGARVHAERGSGLIVTSGGLGPTADDLTAEIVGRFCGREMVLDPALEERIAEILAPMLALARPRPRRDPPLQPQAGRDPAGRDGARPGRHRAGLVVPPARGHGPTVVVLPGPPRELQPMWEMAVGPTRSAPRSRARPTYRRGSCACSGSRSRRSRTRCARRTDAGSTSTRSRSPPACGAARSRSRPATSRPAGARLRRARRVHPERHADTLFSSRRLDDRRAGRRAAGGSHDRGGRVVHRRAAGGPADRPAGSSAYFARGVVVYSNEAKVALAGVDPA
jgi:nicotinamide-nucleotide amidase